MPKCLIIALFSCTYSIANLKKYKFTVSYVLIKKHLNNESALHTQRIGVSVIVCSMMKSYMKVNDLFNFNHTENVGLKKSYNVFDVRISFSYSSRLILVPPVFERNATQKERIFNREFSVLK